MEKDILEMIYQTYYQSLFLFAYSLTHHVQDAEDLVADSFVKAFLSYQENSGNIKNWLLVVLKNQFINDYKKKKKIVSYPMEIIEDPYHALQHYIHDERKRWLYSKIYEFKEVERNVFLLKLQFDLNDEQIAKYLKISKESVRTIRYRAKNKLKDMAREEGIYDGREEV